MKKNLDSLGYKLAMPSNIVDSGVKSLPELIDTIMSIPVGDSIDSESGKLERVSGDTFRIVVSDNHLKSAIDIVMLTNSEEGIDRGD